MNNGDQPAYPLDPGKQPGLNAGLTKREMIAAMALQGMLANAQATEETIKHGVDLMQSFAYQAVEAADLLLKQLETK